MGPAAIVEPSSLLSGRSAALWRGDALRLGITCLGPIGLGIDEKQTFFQDDLESVGRMKQTRIRASIQPRSRRRAVGLRDGLMLHLSRLSRYRAACCRAAASSRAGRAFPTPDDWGERLGPTTGSIRHLAAWRLPAASRRWRSKMQITGRFLQRTVHGAQSLRKRRIVAQYNLALSRDTSLLLQLTRLHLL